MNKALSFDPGKFIDVPIAEPRALFDTPRAWQHGLALLADRTPPACASEARWAQIIADATRIATVWLDMVQEAGWSMENLFGFSRDGFGLAVAVRGEMLNSIRPEYATMLTANGDYRAHFARVAQGSSMLWDFDERSLKA